MEETSNSILSEPFLNVNCLIRIYGIEIILIEAFVAGEFISTQESLDAGLGVRKHNSIYYYVQREMFVFPSRMGLLKAQSK